MDHVTEVSNLLHNHFESMIITKCICRAFCVSMFFIGPESDHWECLSLTGSLTHSCLVNLIDLTLVCEDNYSKIVEVVTVADVDDKDHVGNSLLQIWKKSAK